MWLNGYLYTHASPEKTMYLIMFGAMCLCLVVIIGQIVASRHGNRYKQEEQALSSERTVLIEDQENGQCNIDMASDDSENGLL